MQSFHENTLEVKLLRESKNTLIEGAVKQNGEVIGFD